MQVAQEHIQFDAIYIKVNSKKNYILFKDIYIYSCPSSLGIWGVVLAQDPLRYQNLRMLKLLI